MYIYNRYFVHVILTESINSNNVLLPERFAHKDTGTGTVVLLLCIIKRCVFVIVVVRASSVAAVWCYHIMILRSTAFQSRAQREEIIAGRKYVWLLLLPSWTELCAGVHLIGRKSWESRRKSRCTSDAVILERKQRTISREFRRVASRRQVATLRVRWRDRGNRYFYTNRIDNSVSGKTSVTSGRLVESVTVVIVFLGKLVISG